MGLDMYLYEEKYLSEGWGEGKEHFAAAKELVDKLGMAIETDMPSITIKTKAGYWRKANAIHQWFVNNVQNGEDDCGYYEVGGEQLEELYRICETILLGAVTEEGEVHTSTIYSQGETKKVFEKAQVVVNKDLCEELLPTQSGFFFGGTGYDEFYLQDLKDTMAIIDRLRDEDGKITRWFTYRASW